MCSVDVPLCDAVARLGDPAGRPTPLPTSDEATLHEKATPTNVVCTGHGTPPLHGSHGLCRQHTSEVPAARAAAVLGAALGGLAATLVVPSERDAAARHASVRNAIHELFNGPDLLDEHTTALRERVLQLQQVAASHASRASGGSASMPTAVDNFVRKAAPVASLTGALALRCAEIGTQAALCAARGLSGNSSAPCDFLCRAIRGHRLGVGGVCEAAAMALGYCDSFATNGQCDTVGCDVALHVTRLRDQHRPAGDSQRGAMTPPDTTTCLLHQKLQLLDACIQRRRCDRVCASPWIAQP